MVPSNNPSIITSSLAVSSPFIVNAVPLCMGSTFTQSSSFGQAERNHHMRQGSAIRDPWCGIRDPPVLQNNERTIEIRERLGGRGERLARGSVALLSGAARPDESSESRAVRVRQNPVTPCLARWRFHRASLERRRTRREWTSHLAVSRGITDARAGVE